MILPWYLTASSLTQYATVAGFPLSTNITIIISMSLTPFANCKYVWHVSVSQWVRICSNQLKSKKFLKRPAWVQRRGLNCYLGDLRLILDFLTWWLLKLIIFNVRWKSWMLISKLRFFSCNVTNFLKCRLCKKFCSPLQSVFITSVQCFD